MDRIILKNVSKSFRIGTTLQKGIFARIVSQLSGREPKRNLLVLDSISLKIQAGEIIGIVGSNGAGKSTLLSIIAGICQPTCGSITVHGRAVPIIGLGSALIDRLTMRDNIYLCAAMLGVSRQETKQSFNSIVQLSQLEQFVDTKIYQFSTGMLGRLVFSVAMHSHPDILLLDEVTSNLDKNYVELVENVFTHAAKCGASILVVSHQKHIIQKCHKAIWLDRGQLTKIGSGPEIAHSYWTKTGEVTL